MRASFANQTILVISTHWNVTPVEYDVTASASQVLLCCQMNEWFAAGKVRVPGTKVPGNELSRNEWSVEGKVFRVYRSREQKFPGTNGPGNKWSRERKFHHGNECFRERTVLRTNVPDTRERTEHLNIFLYSAHHSMVFYF